MIEEEPTPHKENQPPTVLWPIILALITAILTIIFSAYVADNIVGAYSALIASLILGWLFTTEKYWRWSKTWKWVTRGVILVLALGVFTWLTIISHPQFEITAINTLEGEKSTYEVTDMLIWNADKFDQYNTSGEFIFRVTPLYYGQRKYGEVIALVYGDQQDDPFEVHIWDNLTKDTLPETFSLTLADVLKLIQIETIDSPKENLLREDQPRIPTGQLTIRIVEKGKESQTWGSEVITIRNAPWEQRSALVQRDDHYDLDLYVKNLGGKSNFTFWWYLVNINKEVDSSPYVTQNGTTVIDQGYEPREMVSLSPNEVFTTTFTLDYPSTPGRFLVEVYAIKKQEYVQFLDPQYSWDKMDIERPWWFSRTHDDLIFVVPAPEVPGIAIEEPFQAELDRLQTQENINIGSALGAAEDITSDHSGIQGRRQFFEKGVIYIYNDQTFSIYGPVYAYFQSMFQDNDDITLPTSPIRKINPGTDQEALIMEFEQAGKNSPPSEIIISSKTRGWLEGWIKSAYYENYGGPDGWLGFPISEVKNYEYSDIQAFEFGYIVYYFPEVDGELNWDNEPVAFPYLASQGNLIGIHAELPWQETGVSLHKGDQVAILQVGGEWTIDRNLGKWTGAEGEVFEPIIEWNISPNAPIGTLIGRIGEEDGSIFPIGRWSNFKAPADGTLYLSINDKNLQDNAGLIAVQIIVQPAD